MSSSAAPQGSFVLPHTGEIVYAPQLYQAVREAGAQGRHEKAFLEALVKMGRLPLDHLREFVDSARANNINLEEHAVASGVCSDDELLSIIASSMQNVVVYDERKFPPDFEQIKRFEPADIRRLGAVPVAFDVDKGQIIVISPDPVRADTRREVPLLLNMTQEEISWQLTTNKRLEELLARAQERSSISDQRETEDVSYRVSAAGESETAQFVDQLIREAQRLNASDIHMEPLDNNEMSVRMRIDSTLEEVRRIPSYLRRSVIGRLKILTDGDIAPDKQFDLQEGRFRFEEEGSDPVDLRVTVLPTKYGEKIVMRLITQRAMRRGLNGVGLEGINELRVQQGLNSRYGALLISGPTGHGKSTTAYEYIHLLNEEFRSIVTVEKPIEQEIHGVTQIPVNHTHGVTFESALKFILRSDPDVIMIGESREPETARTAMDAAMTGHLVVTTIHANDAIGIVKRLQDLGVPPHEVAEGLAMLTAQRLIRRLCVRCRRERMYSREELLQAGFSDYELNLVLKGDTELRGWAINPKGCNACRGRGYNGREGIHEVLLVSQKMKEAISGQEGTTRFREIAEEEEMVTLAADGLLKMMKGSTWLEEVIRVAL